MKQDQHSKTKTYTFTLKSRPPQIWINEKVREIPSESLSEAAKVLANGKEHVIIGDTVTIYIKSERVGTLEVKYRIGKENNDN